jgi:hypothetical protein
MYRQKNKLLFIVDQKVYGPVLYNYASQIHTLIVFVCFIAKCIIPCLNGGRCRGVNKCRCPSGFKGDHCEIGRRVPARSTCTKPCEHGTCRPDNTCLCDAGWYGRLCHQSKWLETDCDGLWLIIMLWRHIISTEVEVSWPQVKISCQIHTGCLSQIGTNLTNTKNIKI